MENEPVAGQKFAEWQSLPIRSRRASQLSGVVGSAIFALFLVGVALVASYIQEWPVFGKMYAALAVLWTATGLYRGYLEWKYTTWRLDNALRIRRGRWWRTETIVPRVRVQHLDLSRGPIDRRFGLATVTVYTAGTTLSSVGLSGLDEAVAVELRDALLPIAQEEQRDGI